jgi:hypothetical protein
VWKTLAALAVPLAACSALSDRHSGAAAVVVRLSSDLPVPSAFERLEVRVETGGATSFERSYDLPQAAHLPATLTLAATSDKAAPPPGTLSPGVASAGEVGETIVLTVRAGRGDVPVAVRAARFVMPSSQRALDVPILAVCAGITCADGQTCDRGVCVAEDIESGSLPGFGT